MMRSLYSGVAGLKTHQTRMDVIGNNIANVNTTAYKSQSMTFSDLMYQTTQSASGANTTTGVGGVNARQIGLGSKTSAIKTAITTQGASQTTNDPFDIITSMVDEVYALDSSLTEFKKVSDLSGASLDNYTNKLSAIGKTVARTGKPKRQARCVGMVNQH